VTGRASQSRLLFDRGSATLEAAIIVPGLLILIGLVIAGGRIAVAGQAVEEAARDAARQASIARSATNAHTSAVAAAGATLDRQGLQCARLDVAIDTSGFRVPAGQPAAVSATVTCVVRLSDVAVPGMPGSRSMNAVFTSALDQFRERSP
jgi:Flp pilus assembly protein TadG